MGLSSFLLDRELGLRLYRWMNRAKMAIWESRNNSSLILGSRIIMLKWKTFMEQAEGLC